MAAGGLLACGSVGSLCPSAEGAIVSSKRAPTQNVSTLMPPSVEPQESAVPSWLTFAPAVFAVVLVVLATAFQGGFALHNWAPLSIFTLISLAGSLLAGGWVSHMSRPLQVAVGALWAFAAWSAISLAWSASPEASWEGAARTFLYAGLFTTPIALAASRRGLALVGYGAIAGVLVLALVTLGRLLADRPS